MSPENYLGKMDSLVNDKNKILTYKMLSHELKIHVNAAKQILTEYLQDRKSKGINLGVNYFLAGFVELNGLRTVRVLVVSDDKLEEAKKHFTELTSYHVYSIFNGTSMDPSSLYSADFPYTRDKEELSKYSAIKHPNIEIKPPILTRMTSSKDSQMDVLKKVESKALTNGTSEKKCESGSKSEEKIIPQNDTSSKDKDLKNEIGDKHVPDVKKQKPGTLMSMWQEQSNGVKKENGKPPAKAKETIKSVQKNSIMSMFSKQAVKNADKPPVLKPETKKSPVSKPPEIKREKSPLKEEKKESKKTSVKRKANSKNSKSSKNKHDGDSESESQPKAKKHRRICTFDDSDSESEADEEKEEAQRRFFLPEEPLEAAVATPVSEDDEPIPPTPPVVRVKGKTKVWKNVKKTYEDDDGFFVTKMEKELVSASEDEEDPLKDAKDKKSEDVTEKKVSNLNKKTVFIDELFQEKVDPLSVLVFSVLCIKKYFFVLLTFLFKKL